MFIKSYSSLFKDKYGLEKRKMEAERIMEKYPNRVAVICERVRITDIPLIDKNKYLVPGDLSIGQFMHVIRQRLKLNAAKAIFLFINNSMIPPSSMSLGEIYNEYKNEDGFLYITYSGENTFG
jgi:GABA(A) receptor-associated protein